MIVRPTRRPASMNFTSRPPTASAAVMPWPRSAAAPLELAKSFCTSTTMSADQRGSQRSCGLFNTIMVRSFPAEADRRYLSVIVLFLQAAFAHRDDVAALDLLAREKPRQKHIERGERVVHDAAREPEHRRPAEIGHQEHRSRQHGKAVRDDVGAALADAFRRLVVGGGATPR